MRQSAQNANLRPSQDARTGLETGSREWGVRQIILAAVLLLVVPFCGAQAGLSGETSTIGMVAYAQSAPQHADSPPHAVSGEVVDSVTGQPIARALVQLGNQRAVLTDHEGHFEFAAVPGDRFVPWATKPGYFSSMRGGGFVETDGSAQSEEKPVTLKLVPEAILYGTVDDESGQPLQGIPVQLKVFRTMNGRGLWTMRQQVATNAEGEFRFSDLEAGRYRLSTGFHMDGLPDAKSSVAYVPMHYPPATASQSEGAITLAPGDHIEARIDPPVEKLYPVTGIVTGYGPSAGTAFEVETRDGEPLQPFTHFDLRTGEFRLMLPGGSYEVKATAYGPVPLQGRQTITVPQAPVSGVVMNVEPFATVPVDIENTGHQRARKRLSASAAALCQYFPQQRRCYRVRQLFRRAAVASSWRRRAGSAGHRKPAARPLRSPGLTAGALVRCLGFPVAALTLPMRSWPLQARPPDAPFASVLRNDSASLHCVVRNPGQSKNIILYLLPMGDLTLQMRMSGLSGMSQNGEADFGDIAPGRYLVLALASDQQSQQEQIPYRDPEAMRRYTPLGQEITITANGKADVQLDIAPNVAQGAP